MGYQSFQANTTKDFFNTITMENDIIKEPTNHNIEYHTRTPLSPYTSEIIEKFKGMFECRYIDLTFPNSLPMVIYTKSEDDARTLLSIWSNKIKLNYQLPDFEYQIISIKPFKF